jgi:hypothetical protein
MLPPIFSISTINWTFKLWDNFIILDKVNETTIDEILLKIEDEHPIWVYIYGSKEVVIWFIPLSSVTLITYCNEG